MIESAVTSFEKVFTEFSFRRLMFVFWTAVILIGGAYLYERYTHQFELARIEKTATILAQLRELKSDGKADQDPEGEAMRSQLTSQLQSTLNSPEFSLPSGLPFMKFFAAALPWLLFSLYYFWGAKKGDAEASLAMFGTLMIAGLFGGIGMLLPYYPYFNSIIFPILHFVIIVALVIRSQKRKQLKVIDVVSPES